MRSGVGPRTMPLQDDLVLSNEQVLRMVKEFKARPMLWDPDHDLYRIHPAKYEAWSEIARIFECDVVDLRRKFNSIFASHRREKGKVRHGNKSRWYLYDVLSFLPSHVQNRPSSNRKASTKTDESHKQTDESIDEVNVQDAASDNSEDDTEFIQEEIIIKNEPEAEPPPRRVHYRKAKVVRPARPSFKRHFSTRERGKGFTEAYVKAPAKGKDEYDRFGEYIAVSLRKHDERTRSMIKQAINNILFEQEMKKYNNPSFLAERNPLNIGDSDDCEK